MGIEANIKKVHEDVKGIDVSKDEAAKATTAKAELGKIKEDVKKIKEGDKEGDKEAELAKNETLLLRKTTAEKLDDTKKGAVKEETKVAIKELHEEVEQTHSETVKKSTPIDQLITEIIGGKTPVISRDMLAILAKPHGAESTMDFLKKSPAKAAQISELHTQLEAALKANPLTPAEKPDIDKVLAEVKKLGDERKAEEDKKTPPPAPPPGPAPAPKGSPEELVAIATSKKFATIDVTVLKGLANVHLQERRLDLLESSALSMEDLQALENAIAEKTKEQIGSGITAKDRVDINKFLVKLRRVGQSRKKVEDFVPPETGTGTLATIKKIGLAPLKLVAYIVDAGITMFKPMSKMFGFNPDDAGGFSEMWRDIAGNWIVAGRCESICKQYTKIKLHDGKNDTKAVADLRRQRMDEVRERTDGMTADEKKEFEKDFTFEGHYLPKRIDEYMKKFEPKVGPNQIGKTTLWAIAQNQRPDIVAAPAGGKA